ncbi:MAG: enoyl-CoA hydratase-related protein [Proteobacteria bacterium]|nr:enoyl-CoA hydratase-related protein [Pseudomonadota bacterium]
MAGQNGAGSEEVRLEIENGLATITLNRPSAYNALNLAMAEGLLNAAILCDEDPRVRAVMITGEGRAFCSGGDIRQMKSEAEGPGGAGGFLKRLTVKLHAAIATLARMEKPVVTAVNGPAAGAGLSLAIAGDLVVASEEATLTVAYTAIGLAPDGSSTFYLPRMIGPKRAYEWIASNETVGMEKAQELGLVNQVFSQAQFRSQAEEYGMRLAKGPTVALGEAKRLLLAAAESSLETAIEHERRAIARCGRSRDFEEGAAAFLEKRTATFSGN